MIEKRITHQLLDSGELVLTPKEREALLLPEHSTTITVDVEGETFHAQWSGRSRKLTGEILTERIQDYGQADGLLRLRAVDQTYRLQLLPPGTTMQFKDWLPPVRVTRTSIGNKAARRRATVDRQFHADAEYHWGASNGRHNIGFLTAARQLLSEQLKAAGFDALELVELRLQGEELATLDNFEELLAVDVSNVDRMPHQEAVARHALSRLRGRAVLADEVGLGKTVEAGLAVKELTLRGLAKRVLILCPAPLRDQWRDEMNTKFDMAFAVAYRGAEVADQDKLIISLQLGTSQIEKLTRRPWDIVIVDEAHRAAGAGARKRRELITALTTACRYAFFLTATPIQNDLLELYRLIELLRPGTFTSVSAFKSQYVRSSDPRTPNDPATLRRLISSAMIRTTRGQAGVDRVTRRAEDVPIDLGRREQELYALSTHLLRNIMRSPSDTMRRRSLALRLTASPFSMGTTALRMAERHPDGRVRQALNDMAHLAMDIQGSARENTALQITREWVRDHGRVLIFTQHTDTVTGLLRRMEAEGLRARSFHGSMSPTERAATVAAFRSGDAPIMISTDAGAEGQNLQFCNCVLNYDLPWNPMRIEQRIGRVDRLTQPCDEVFVANLYARRTVDENVYRLLAEKLRMFELLFGQVTTILGELDDSKAATFESRVLEALFAPNDTRMQNLLSQLGTELADARERASTLIEADSGLSKWMASAFEHRKGLTKAGSNELAPEIAERARIRQRRLQTWVRRVLEALGAHTLHDTGEGEGAFLTVQFDEELADELGDRTLIHIAFDRKGMEHHPEAELCAVGSPVFDELLGLLRMRGDMHATVPVIPDDPGPSPLKASPTTRLVRRRLIPSGTWSGQATFRATVGEAETTEHIITADVNGKNAVRLPRRPLEDGESLTAAFDDPVEIISAFERTATEQLELLRRGREEEVGSDRARELSRIQTGYNAQIREAAYEDKVRLQRALASEEQRLGRRPDIRARAKILALTLDEDDWLVEETWEGPGGSGGTLTYEWDPSEPPVVVSDASLKVIEVLALCSNGHWLDETECQLCGSCDDGFCSACGDEAVFADCVACGLSSCATCRATTGGLCLGCGSPERAPELDREFAIAWRLNRGVILHVGDRTAELARAGHTSPLMIVRDEDANDSNRVRLRSYAIQNQLPADSGVQLRDLTDRLQAQDPTRLLLRTSTAIGIELTTAGEHASTIDADAIDDLPTFNVPRAHSESAVQLAALLSKLRAAVPPPPPPCVLVTRRSTFTDLHLEVDRLVQRITTIGDDGLPELVEEQSSPIDWRNFAADEAKLGEAELAGLRVSLERRNDAVLVTTWSDIGIWTKSQWLALPQDASDEDQFAWYEVLRSLNTPGGRVGRRTREAPDVVNSFPTPSECELVDRHIDPVAQVAAAEPGVELAPADRKSLVALNINLPKKRPQAVDRVPAELGRALIERASRPFSTMVANGFEIREKWRGHGTATHEYRTWDGLPIAPTLDDTELRDNDFGVCRDGHFYAVGTSALCGACNTWACRACDFADDWATISCPRCSSSACGRCLSVEHAVPGIQCVLCGDVACQGCGRDPEVQPCPICDRQMCTTCRVGDLCRTCSQLAPATPEQVYHLPAELAAVGAAALIGSDSDATTLLLDRGGIAEQVVIRMGAVDRWVVFGSHQIDDAYRLRLAASRKFNGQVRPITELLNAETPIPGPHLVVRSERFYYPSWSVGDSNERHSTRWHSSPDTDLAQLVASEFPTLTRLPTRVESIPTHVEQTLARATPVVRIELKMRWNRVGRDIAITAAGILDRNIDKSTVEDTVSSWAQSEVSFDWIAATWNPLPQIRAYSQCEDTTAVIVSLASLLALGVQVDERTDWYAITDSPSAAAATMLARWLGAEDADLVSDFVDPNELRVSTVMNATEVSRSVRAVASVLPRVKDGPDVTTAALQAWMPAAQVREPEIRSLPAELADKLQQQWSGRNARTSLAISGRVDETVTVENGVVWRHEVALSPGRIDARRICSTTTLPLDAGVLDREGHFVHEGARCAYCQARLCSVCSAGLVSCDCCDVAICKTCVAQQQRDLWLCPACTNMRPVTRKEARQNGRMLLKRNMLIGEDALHVVVVERDKQEWLRHAGDGEMAPIGSPSVSRFLGERLIGTDVGSS
jgi:superfamily II DNA or RNA helicase